MDIKSKSQYKRVMMQKGYSLDKITNKNMICKYCYQKMEIDSIEGISYTEQSNYICECGATCSVYENNAEINWNIETGE